MPHLLAQQRPAHGRGCQAGLPRMGDQALWHVRGLRHALPRAAAMRKRCTGAPGRSQQEAQPGDGVRAVRRHVLSIRVYTLVVVCVRVNVLGAALRSAVLIMRLKVLARSMRPAPQPCDDNLQRQREPHSKGWRVRAWVCSEQQCALSSGAHMMWQCRMALATR